MRTPAPASRPPVRPPAPAEPGQPDERGARASGDARASGASATFAMPAACRASRGLLAVVFGLSLLLFAYGWYVSRERPGASSVADGYYHGFDQSGYKSEAEDLSEGHLPERPEKYPFGLGYPVLAVPQLWAGFTRDPFAAPDALIFAACVTLVVTIGARMRSPAFGLAAGGLVALASPLLGLMVYPWSNTATAFAVLAAMAATTTDRRPGWGTGVVVGLVSALALAARYVDVVFPLAILGFAAVRDLRRWLRPLAAAAAVVVVVGIGIGVTHQRVLGGFFRTPYVLHLDHGTSDQGLSSYNLERVPGAGLALFGTGRDAGRRMPADPLLRLMPWVVLAPAGLLLLARRRHHLLWPLTGAAAVSLAGTVFYLSFRGAAGFSLAFGSLRYFGPWFGIWALLTAYAGACVLDRYALSTPRPPETPPR